MIVHSNFRYNFYEKIAKEHTLIIVNADVDALCASIILTYALSCDDATFSLKPVDSWTAIEQAIEEHKDQIKNLVLINCGASQSLIKIFVLDSHRPVHLDNIYSGNLSINVLVNQSEIEEWNVPEESKIYEIDSDDENEKQNDGDDTKIADDSNDFYDIASQIENRALKNQKKSNWKRNRATLIWNYYMSSWYSMSSAVFLLNLIHELGKSSPEMMWCAAVGLTSQFTDQLISVETYTNTCIDHMRTFIRKFAPRKSIEQSRGDGVFRITFDKELILPLYSHWSIFQSMCCDAMFVCQSSFWSQKGEANLKHILAKLGLTLTECRQDYAAMSSDRRLEVFDILEKYMDARFAAFNAYFSYSTCYNSSDFARILSLRLECKNQSKYSTLYDRFSNANFIMHHFLKFGGRETPELEKMFSRYKSALKEITLLAFSCINHGHIVSTSRYFLLNLQQGSYIGYLTSRHCLNLFLYLLHRAFASSNSKRKMGKPLIISFPEYSSSKDNYTNQLSVENNTLINKINSNLNNNSNQWYIIVGIMPLAHTVTDIQRKNVLGRAFDHVTEEIKIDVKKDGFDSNIIKIRSDDRTKFFNSLEARLEIG